MRCGGWLGPRREASSGINGLSFSFGTASSFQHLGWHACEETFYLEFFQTDRATGQPKGIVALDLGDIE